MLNKVAWKAARSDGGMTETVAKVEGISKLHGTTITTLSVAWLLANPAITSVILGASRVEQLTDTLAGADYELDSALKTELDEVSIEFRRGDATA